MRAMPGGSKRAVDEPRGPARRTARHAKGFHHGRWCDRAGGDDGDDPTEMSARDLGAATASDVVGERLEPCRGVTTETVERPRQPARHPSGIAPVAGVAQLPRHDHRGLPARPARPRRPWGSTAGAASTLLTQATVAGHRLAVGVAAPRAALASGTVAGPAIAASATARSQRTDLAAFTARAGHGLRTVAGSGRVAHHRRRRVAPVRSWPRVWARRRGWCQSRAGRWGCTPMRCTTPPGSRA